MTGLTEGIRSNMLDRQHYVSGLGEVDDVYWRQLNTGRKLSVIAYQ